MKKVFYSWLSIVNGELCSICFWTVRLMSRLRMGQCALRWYDRGINFAKNCAKYLVKSMDAEDTKDVIVLN